MKQEMVSVIVPTRNSQKFIGKCLESIKNQTYKNVEIIVVDNNSSDSTKEIAMKFTSKVHNRGNERSAQRNYGAKMSKGKYFLFIDSDMVLTRNVIKECVEGKGVAVIIPEKSFGKGYWARCKALEKEMYIGDENIEAPRFFEKRLFWSVGGWNESMVAAEDWDLKNRIKKRTRISRIKALIWHNEDRLTLLGTMKKKYYYGKKMRDVTLDRNLRKQLSPFRKSFLLNVDKLFLHPVLAIGFLVMNVMKFISFKIGKYY